MQRVRRETLETLITGCNEWTQADSLECSGELTGLSGDGSKCEGGENINILPQATRMVNWCPLTILDYPFYCILFSVNPVHYPAHFHRTAWSVRHVIISSLPFIFLPLILIRLIMAHLPVLNKRLRPEDSCLEASQTAGDLCPVRKHTVHQPDYIIFLQFYRMCCEASCFLSPDIVTMTVYLHWLVYWPQAPLLLSFTRQSNSRL